MKYTGFIAGVVVVATTLTGAATLAEGTDKPRHGPHMTFEMLDADRDGQVTKAEMQQHREARFSETDTNNDGVLSAEELQARGKARAADRVAGMISKFDKDGDGALSIDEMPGPKKGGDMFSHMDKDGDGSVSKEEFADARSHMGKRGKGGRHGAGNSDKN